VEMGHGVLLAKLSTDRWLFNKNKKIRHTIKFKGAYKQLFVISEL
jgi:hypothetical protein